MLRTAIATVVFAALWVILTLTVGGIGILDIVGWTLLYLVGLVWVQFLVEQEANRIEGRRHIADTPDVRRLSERKATFSRPRRRTISHQSWNPLDPSSRWFSFAVCVICFCCFATLAISVTVVGLVVAKGEPLSPKTKALAVAAGVLALAALATAIAQSQRLRQSLAMLATYSALFAAVYILLHLRFGKDGEVNEYELPMGGGSDSIKASSMKVQKVTPPKYLTNRFSNIYFSAPPPIDQIDVKLTEEVANQYKAGQGAGGLGDGEGEGGGFGGGTGKGKIRFIRLRHSDKAWDKNFGIGGDRNLLASYVEREPKSRGKVAEETEAIEIATLGTFPHKKSPPMVYVCGIHSFAPSPADKKVLKQYVTERHGMIVGDLLGPQNQGFHGSFIAVMNEITGVTPVAIPRDDRIHQRPYELPLLPVVVAHGGTVPLGWKVDGRWAVYYHPGALSDAWRDDRAGIKKDIAELCYQLGINIIYYSHREYNQWLMSQQP